MALPRLKGEAVDAHRVADAGAPEQGKTGKAPSERPRPSAEGQTPDNLEEVRVTGVRVSRSATATNTSAPLIETPATVNVLTGDFLGAIGARRIEEALQYVPGASAESVNASGTAFNIRGFSTQVFGGGASGEGSVQIDNHRTAARRYHFDPALYERIDVLKGAAALLYGTTDPGGVVRYVSKKPQFERLHRFETTLGSFETARGTLDLTGPLGKGDQAAYRLIATGLNSNQPFHGGNDGISFDDRRIINPQLAWLTPGDGELRLNYEYSQHKSTLDSGIKRLANGAFTFNTKPFLGPDSFLDREHHIGVAEFIQPIADNWEILVGGKMGCSRLDYLWDAGFGLPDANNRLNRFTSRSNARLQHEEIRAQLAGQFNTGALLQHQVTVGIYDLSTGVNVDRVSVLQRGVVSALNPMFGPAPALGRPAPHFSTALEEQAVYVQDYISVGEKLKIFGGLRYTDAEADLTLRSGRRPGADTALNYTIGAIYNLQPRFNPFFSYATALTPQTGARSGGTGAVPFREGEQIEAGVKSEWLGGRLATTTSIFQIEQTNIAEGDPANRGFFILAGDQRARLRVRGGRRYYRSDQPARRLQLSGCRIRRGQKSGQQAAQRAEAQGLAVRAIQVRGGPCGMAHRPRLYPCRRTPGEPCQQIQTADL